MNTRKISIIIPYRNIEKYISQCLDSVVNQTEADIEIICVNDASSDKTQEIVNSYIDKDQRIKYIELGTQKGQAYARNKALEIAQGEYIGFVDGDDWVDVTMFEKLYNKAKQTDADIVITSAYSYDDKSGQIDETNKYYSTELFDETFDNKVFSYKDNLEGLLDINAVIWNKLYKREFLNKNNVKFQSGFIYEDLPFVFETYTKAEKVTILREYLYFYRENRQNSTMSDRRQKIFDRIDMVYLTLNLLKQLPEFGVIYPKVFAWVINDLFHRFVMISDEYRLEYFYKMKKIFTELDDTGIDPEFLSLIYHYKEYKLVKAMSFDECNQYVFKEYIGFKERENKFISDKNKEIYEQQQAYETMITEIKESTVAFYENLIKENKEVSRIEIEKIIEETRVETERLITETKLSTQQFYENLIEENKEAARVEIERIIEETRIETERLIAETKLSTQQFYENLIEENKEAARIETERLIEEAKVSTQQFFEEKIVNIKQDYEKVLQDEYEKKALLEKEKEALAQKYNKDTKYLKTVIKILGKIRDFYNDKKRLVKQQIANKDLKIETEKPKVSVILPVYNVGQYLRDSLDSLINQELKEIQIICVNDGSTDNSAEILEEFRKKDSRIIVVTKPQNEGTGLARNDGLKLATGECIGFVDPDDWVKPNMFKRLYEVLKEKDVDIVMSLPDGFNEEKQKVEPFPYFVDGNFSHNLDNKIFNRKDISPFKYPMCVWNKLYTKRLFDDNNISFAEGLDFEDHKVIFKSLICAEKIYFIREKLYVYRFNRGGSILSDNNRRLLDHIEIFDIVEKILKETNTYEQLRADFIFYKIHNLLYYYSMIKEEFKDEYHQKMLEAIDKTDLKEEEIKELLPKYPELKQHLQK